MSYILVEHIIQLEKQLLDKLESTEVLAELIDNEFIKIGSSSVIYKKAAVMQWLASDPQSELIGTAFKTHQLADNIILLTYISHIKDTPMSESKQAMRSSIWRLTDGNWRMVFHQGTPFK